MVAVAHLPEHATAPVGLQDGTDLVGLVGHEAVRLSRRSAVIKKRVALGQASVLGRIGHAPGVNGHAIEIDEIDRRIRALIRREQRISRPSSFAVPRAQTDPRPPEFGLLDWHSVTPLYP